MRLRNIKKLLKQLDKKDTAKNLKSLKIVYINPGENKKEILKKYPNKKEILIVEFI